MVASLKILENHVEIPGQKNPYPNPLGSLSSLSESNLSVASTNAITPTDITSYEIIEPPTMSQSDWSTEGADLWIRTSDGVDIKVHKIVLELASEVFDNLIFRSSNHASRHYALSGQRKSKDNLPVVQMDDNNVALRELLRYIYPVIRSPMANLPDFTGVVDLAHKYKVQSAIHNLAEHLKRSPWIQTQPISVYILALRHGLQDVIKAVYPHLLSLQLSTEYMQEKLTPEERLLSIGDFFSLANSKSQLSQIMIQKLEEAFSEARKNVERRCNQSQCWVPRCKDSVRSLLRQNPGRSSWSLLEIARTSSRTESCICSDVSFQLFDLFNKHAQSLLEVIERKKLQFCIFDST